MCGLIAVVARRGQPVPAALLHDGAGVLAHRGPDDFGMYIDGPVGFGFRRLAIIDTSAAGHQPMSSADAAMTIVFNGEIYNYLEVREELVARGHAFRSHSDTEVLLNAYREWGRACVQRFNGMFAFLIHDRRDGSLFGARDRLGVKPLYVWEDDGWIVFASEPRAIGATGLAPLAPDWGRFAQSLRWHAMDHEGGCCLAGICPVPAGHTLHLAAPGERLVVEPYWRLPEPPAASERAESRWIEELAALATDAVRLRLRSDVPVGFTLSGGIDSSLLICEAAHIGAPQGGLIAFSYQDAQHDEREPIRDTVAQTGARLISLDGDSLDVAELLPKVVAANGEPVHSTSAVANYALFDLARRHGVKVLLGGQGADEVFGGYRSFQWDYWHSLFAQRRWAGLLADVRAFTRLHGRGVAATLSTTLLRSLRIAASTTWAYQRLRAHRRMPLRADATQALFAPDLLALAAPMPLDADDFLMAGAQRRAATVSPLPMYLRIEDRVSMAHSVEARLPFTDYRLVEHAFRMPDTLKFSGGLNKRALRRVAERRVPPSVASRVQKLGFPVADDVAAARRLQSLCRDLATTSRFAGRGIYDRDAVARLLMRPARAEDVDPLFHLAQAELWLDGMAASR